MPAWLLAVVYDHYSMAIPQSESPRAEDGMFSNLVSPWHDARLRVPYWLVIRFTVIVYLWLGGVAYRYDLSAAPLGDAPVLSHQGVVRVHRLSFAIIHHSLGGRSSGTSHQAFPSAFGERLVSFGGLISNAPDWHDRRVNMTVAG